MKSDDAPYRFSRSLTPNRFISLPRWRAPDQGADATLVAFLSPRGAISVSGRPIDSESRAWCPRRNARRPHAPDVANLPRPHPRCARRLASHIHVSSSRASSVSHPLRWSRSGWPGVRRARPPRRSSRRFLPSLDRRSVHRATPPRTASGVGRSTAPQWPRRTSAPCGAISTMRTSTTQV